jgi:hypothetical protein
MDNNQEQGARVMEGCRDRQFVIEPQQTFHRQYEALRAVFVEGQPLEPVAVRFGFKVSTLQSMVSRFRADRRGGVTPPFFARTAADGPAGHRRAEAAPLPKSPKSPTPAS